MTKTIGKQYYLEEVGKKPLLCKIIGHHWKMNMSSRGPGSFDEGDNWVPPEEHRAYYCTHPQCGFWQHEYENYPDLSKEAKMAEAEDMHRSTQAMIRLLDGAE